MKNISSITILYSLFFCLLPFIFTEQIVDPVLIPRQIFASIFVSVIIIFLAVSLFNKQKLETGFLKLYLLLGLVAFLLITLFSAVFSVNSVESIYKISKLYLEVSFFIVTTVMIINKKLSVIHISKAIVLFSIIIIISVVWQFTKALADNIEIFALPNQFTSFFANKNLLASIIFLTIPFVFIAAATGSRWKMVALAVYGLELLIILLLQTKAAILAIFISFIIFNGFLFFNKKEKNTGLPVKPIVIITLLFFIMVGFFYIKTKYDIKFDFTSQQAQVEQATVSANTNISMPSLTNKNSAFSRFRLWDNSLEMIKENPVTGVGAGNWQIFFPKYGLGKFEEETANGVQTYQRPHNDFLWVFCETGIAGICFYVSIFVFAIIYLLKLIRIQKTILLKWKYWALLSGIIGYVIIASVDFPFERTEHQLLLMLILSIITAGYFLECKEEKNAKKIPPSLVMIFLIGAVIVSFVVSVNRYSGEKNTHKLYISHYNANWPQLIKDAGNSINSCYNMDPMSTPIDWYKGVAFFTLGNLEAAKTCFENAYSLHPYHIHVINNLASCYEKLLLHDKAIEYYQKALRISSGFEETILNLSAVYFNIKNYEMAFKTISQCKTSCTDPKYSTFLPAILRATTNEIMKKQTDESIKIKLQQLISAPDSLVIMYKKSVEKNIEFENFILNSPK